jgi:hypothetical protein
MHGSPRLATKALHAKSDAAGRVACLIACWSKRAGPGSKKIYRGENVVCAKRFELYPRANHGHGYTFAPVHMYESSIGRSRCNFSLAVRRCESRLRARRAAMVDHLSLLKRGVFANLPICRIPRGSDFYLLLASEFVVETWTGSCGLVNTYVLLHLGYSGHVFLFHSLS